MTEGSLAAACRRTHARARDLQPNDPTGAYLTAGELGALLSGLPERVHVLLDEALIHFQDAEDLDACMRLVDAFPRLLVVRTFSKVYGLSGLRAGYAVGADADLLNTIAAGARRERAHASRGRVRPADGDGEIERRRGAVVRERPRLLEGLRPSAGGGRPTARRTSSGCEPTLSRRRRARRAPRRQGVIVAPGGPLGADDHVRATVRNERPDRLLRALENAWAQGCRATTPPGGGPPPGPPQRHIRRLRQPGCDADATNAAGPKASHEVTGSHLHPA